MSKARDINEMGNSETVCPRRWHQDQRRDECGGVGDNMDVMPFTTASPATCSYLCLILDELNTLLTSSLSVSLATFQELNHHVGLAAATEDSPGREDLHHHRQCCWTGLFRGQAYWRSREGMTVSHPPSCCARVIILGQGQTGPGILRSSLGNGPSREDLESKMGLLQRSRGQVTSSGRQQSPVSPGAMNFPTTAPVLSGSGTGSLTQPQYDAVRGRGVTETQGHIQAFQLRQMCYTLRPKSHLCSERIYHIPL